MFILAIFLLQATYVILLFVLRPFKTIVGNIIECVNEVFYLCLVGILLRYHSDNVWNNNVATVYLLVMLSNIVVMTILMIGNSVYLICKKYCVRKEKVLPKTTKIIILKRDMAKMNLQLPDNSAVGLNGGSSLSVPQNNHLRVPSYASDKLSGGSMMKTNMDENRSPSSHMNHIRVEKMNPPSRDKDLRPQERLF